MSELVVHHLQPPPAQRAGGLEAAIAGLCAALEKEGVTVRQGMPAAAAPGTVVHLHGLWQWPYVAAARRCRTLGLPYVVSPHGMLEPWAWRHKRWKKWPWFHLVEKHLLRGAAALHATAESEATHLRARFPASRIDVLPLGLTSDATADYAAAREKLGWAADERILLFLSRVHPKKGLDLLLTALAQDPRPHWRLVVVGDGDAAWMRHLRALAAGVPRVDWIGPVWGDERWPYFQGADLFCLPTHSENFGLAVLEALQAGTPVLTTRATPWGSILSPPDGFICDPEVGSVRAALRVFEESPPLAPAARLELAHRTHGQFAWSRLAPRYATFYQSVAGLHNRPPYVLR